MRILILALLVLAPFASGEEKKPSHHVLVELFTSQG